MRTVSEYIIQECGGNKAAFARLIGVLPQQVTKWTKEGAFVVTDDGFIIPARTIRITERVKKSPSGEMGEDLHYGFKGQSIRRYPIDRAL